MSHELRQGEIMTGVIHQTFVPNDAGSYEIQERVVGFVLAATQDCDLFKDHKARKDGKQGGLSGVLLFEAKPADQAKIQLNLGAKEWKPVTNNVVERYQFLPNCPEKQDKLGKGFPQILIDFSRYFTVPPIEIERQIAAGLAFRRARLNVPYRERVQNRAAFFLQRVALPDDYES